MTPQTWWYMNELERKTRALECDKDRVDRLLDRPNLDPRTRQRLMRELEDIEMRAGKLKRGLLF